MNKKRKGLRVRTNKVDPEVRAAVLKFTKWLRKRYEFPIRLPIYLSPKEKILSKDGESCYSIFFEPYEKKNEPFIKVSTGEFITEKKRIGRDNSLAGILSSIAFQLQFYLGWCNHKKITAYQARINAKVLMKQYSFYVKHP